MAVRAAIEIDDGLALELMRFGADLLEYPCPTYLPCIWLDPNMVAHGQFTSLWVQNVTLKRWRDGSHYDQGVLVHELLHHTQSYNGIPMNNNVFDGVNEIEVEALTAQMRWLQSVGEDPRTHISFNTILKLTGDQDFARMEWLEAHASTGCRDVPLVHLDVARG